LPLFRRIINRIKRAELDLGIVFGQYLGDGGRQRGLAMVNVTNRPDVYMRLAAIKFFLGHCFSSNLFREYRTPNACSVISVNLLEFLPKLRIDFFDPL